MGAVSESRHLEIRFSQGFIVRKIYQYGRFNIIFLLIFFLTVAILAQGTSWAVAVTQAFFNRSMANSESEVILHGARSCMFTSWE